MVKRIFILFTCLAFAVGLSAPATAAQQENDPGFEPYSLGELVISAQTPSVEEVSSVAVLTAEDIEATHSLNVSDALQYAPGVIVTMGRKGTPRVSIRGFNQAQALVLIDGIPFYETNYGSLDLNSIPSDMIAKIEVIKGAPSVLYGPNAMAGVINIITKKPGKTPSTGVTAEIGDYGNYRASVHSGAKKGMWNYWLGFTRKEYSAWRMSDDFNPKEGVIINKPGKTEKSVMEDGGKRNNSDLRSNNFWAKVGVEPNKGTEVYANFYFLDMVRGMPPSVNEQRVFKYRPAFSWFARFNKYQDWGIDLTGRKEITDKFSLKAKLFYHNHEDNYVSYEDKEYTKEIADSTFKDYFVGASLFGEYKIAETNTLRASLHYKGDSHKERDDSYIPFAETFSYTGSVGLEDEWRPIPGLAIVAGVSYDWFDVDKAEAASLDKKGDFQGMESLKTPDMKTELNPMIGATYTFNNKMRLFGSVARKTRFPTLSQLYSSKSGNTELDAETSINYTLGLAWPFCPTASAELSVFHHHIKDLISRDAPHVDGKYINYGKILMTGFELSADWHPLTDLSFMVSYMYNSAKDESDNKVTDDVVRVPEHTFQVGVRYIVPKIKTRLEARGLFIGNLWEQLPTPTNRDQEAIEQGAHFVANLNLRQPICKQVEAFAHIENILDTNYESEYGFPGMGRNFWVGVSTKF